MGTHRLQMRFQQARLFVFVLGRGIGTVGGEGDFGIDNHLAVVGILDQDVRLHLLSALLVGEHLAPFILQELLPEVVLTLDQTGCLKQTLQNHFPPVALHLRVAFQGTRQVVRLLAEAVVQVHQLLDAFAQRETLLGFGTVDLLHLLAEVFQVFAQRTEQGVQMLGVQTGEVLRLALEDAVGEVLKLDAHALVQGFRLFCL